MIWRYIEEKEVWEWDGEKFVERVEVLCANWVF